MEMRRSSGPSAPQQGLVRLAGLCSLSLIAVAWTGCGNVGGSGSGSSGLGGLEDRSSWGDAGVSSPTPWEGDAAVPGEPPRGDAGDGTMGGGGFDGGTGGGCQGPIEPPPPPSCFEVGGFCALVDFATDPSCWCPQGLVPLELPCEQDPTTMNPTICCGFPGTDVPQPPPVPVDQRCLETGNLCVAVDPNADPQYFCPEGTQPVGLECDQDPMSQTPVICCGRADVYPGDPMDPGYPGDPNDPGRPGDPNDPGYPGGPTDPGHPGQPGACPDASDPQVIYVSYDVGVCDAISYTCPSNHVPFDSDCGCGCLGY